jgi:hypothetical protein
MSFIMDTYNHPEISLRGYLTIVFSNRPYFQKIEPELDAKSKKLQLLMKTRFIGLFYERN